ncbi:L-glyceraldehyde 3-phosphate reductase [Microbacteriaceae bacterium SG_E_30_P1]|uniref:L-glyceraldehyde 3-phosphate reductase n=1 Tax=Antiquaquibacter oligotrophicus TaxID=2880260 RepID=A0ABT6KQA6_9MICO|nr:aldo/keto reductase [Antiquaquibacter oligotrophicus]MDH6181287.1 L-glyceraldehyde 3-phosphate reductase [Antiquaquibacter oligotrophicus]UDF13020.1 aldo/keto reductase [Antiquaquibacter oligotrophicus]
MVYEAASDRYEQLEYVRVGRSGLKLPKISLGLWNNFGNDRPLETQRSIIRRAFDLGVTHFDLANNYGPPAGAAESNFGRVMREDLSPYRDELIISSKAGYDMWDGPYGEWGSRKYVLASLDQSLARTGLDYFDIFYSHRPDPDTPIEETMGALATAVHSGRALYVGVSNYSPEQTRAAAAALAEHKIPLLIHQPRYSMFDRHIEDGLFPVLDELGMGSIVFSPLAQGLLTDRYLDGIPSDSRAAEGRWMNSDTIDEVYLSRARALNEIAAARGQSLAQLALLWVLRVPEVTSALIGASSVAQLENNLAALDGAALTDDELAAIEPFAVHGTGLR